MSRLAENRRTLVMGVLNVTPDSFSDGGLWIDPAAAVAHGRAMLAEGADLLDVGGESTRPGAQRPTAEEELRRVVPVVDALVADGAAVSVDTMRAEVADAALAVGASMVNDVSGGRADDAMVPFVADAGVPYVCMHWRGHADHMQERARYRDVVGEVCDELASRVDAILDAGVDPAGLVLDPGIGFAKTAEQNWALLRGLDRVRALGHPVLVGASRKAFLGALLADPRTGEPRPARDRDSASAAVTVVAALAGAWCVRVHDVASSTDAVRVVARLGEEPG